MNNLLKEKFKLSGPYKRTKLACYAAYLSMSSVFCVPSLLFVTFHETYGVSYTLLGTLVLINFCTQLSIDLTITFFSKFFNVKKTVSVMPFITSCGMIIYALIPTLFPDMAYLGLAFGTVVFSVAAGLSEVLLSPIMAAIPSENPERDMSLLHSLYAWGVVTMILISTAFLKIFGTDNWMFLILLLALFPVVAGVLFSTSKIPELTLSSLNSSKSASKNRKGIALCCACIFLGSAAENVMTNWISGFTESALNIPKELCDIIGFAMFAVLLGTVRTVYAKYGRNISLVLLVGMAGATACYVIAGLCGNVFIALAACILTGAFTSMLWPGTLILMEENMPALGVAAYALMAAGGDLGGSSAPQLMGIVTDSVAATDFALRTAERLGLTADQVGLRAGMVIAGIFPALGIILMIVIRRYFRKNKA